MKNTIRLSNDDTTEAVEISKSTVDFLAKALGEAAQTINELADIDATRSDNRTNKLEYALHLLGYKPTKKSVITGLEMVAA